MQCSFLLLVTVCQALMASPSRFYREEVLFFSMKSVILFIKREIQYISWCVSPLSLSTLKPKKILGWYQLHCVNHFFAHGKCKTTSQPSRSIIAVNDMKFFYSIQFITRGLCLMKTETSKEKEDWHYIKIFS